MVCPVVQRRLAHACATCQRVVFTDIGETGGFCFAGPRERGKGGVPAGAPDLPGVCLGNVKGVGVKGVLTFFAFRFEAGNDLQCCTRNVKTPFTPTPSIFPSIFFYSSALTHECARRVMAATVAAVRMVLVVVIIAAAMEVPMVTVAMIAMVEWQQWWQWRW